MKNIRQKIVGLVAHLLSIRSKVILDYELKVEITDSRQLYWAGRDSNYRHWTKAHDQYILLHWSDSIESIANTLDRTESSVTSRRHRLKHNKV